MKMELGYHQIDKLYEWVQKNRLRLELFKGFENASRAAALECFHEAFPGPARLEEITFYLKQYKPSPLGTCAACNGSGRIIAFGVALQQAKPKTLQCNICHGMGKNLSTEKINQNLID